MTIDLKKAEIIIHRHALTAIFDECDRYDHDETGGRLVGKFKLDDDGKLRLTLSGVIGPGTRARRSPTSLFQDGAYQERRFRALEQRYPDIEHLGNWHTHHVNGHPTLSHGDIRTYHNIVNSKSHNTDVFYALLVTRKRKDATGDDRFAVRHYLLARGQSGEHEVPPGRVRIIDAPAIGGGDAHSATLDGTDVRLVRRVLDSTTLKKIAPDLKPYRTKAPERVYWRGPLTLIDGSSIDIVVAEPEQPDGMFNIFSPGSSEAIHSAITTVGSCATAVESVITIERRLNAQIFRAAPHNNEITPSSGPALETPAFPAPPEAADGHLNAEVGVESPSAGSAQAPRQVSPSGGEFIHGT